MKGRIAVDERSQLGRLDTAARRLQVLDPSRLEQVVAAAEAFVAAHDCPEEPYAVFATRVQRIRGKAGVS